MTIEDDIIAHLSFPVETRHVEFKESNPWPKLKYKIAKNALAMANLTDGGILIVGVSERDDHFNAEGMSEEDLSTYDGDQVQEFVNKYADPAVQLSGHKVTWEGKRFFAIVIREFSHAPVICKKNYERELRQGAMYTRATRKPETVVVPGQSEMREIIERATEKSLERLLRTMARTGISIEGLAAQGHEARFAAQRGASAEILTESSNGAHWKVTIHPERFESERVESLERILELVERSQVKIRGWSYPHIQRKSPPIMGRDWSGTKTVFHEHVEAWRLYQSLQFDHVVLCREPAYYESFLKKWRMYSPRETDAPKGFLMAISALYSFTEIFEFARRFAQHSQIEEPVTVSIGLYGIQGWELYFGEDEYNLWGEHYRSSNCELANDWTVQRTDLLTNSRQLALTAASWFFERFGWLRIPTRFLEDQQQRFLERRF